VSYVILIIY